MILFHVELSLKYLMISLNKTSYCVCFLRIAVPSAFHNCYRDVQVVENILCPVKKVHLEYFVSKYM